MANREDALLRSPFHLFALLSNVPGLNNGVVEKDSLRRAFRVLLISNEYAQVCVCAFKKNSVNLF